MYYITVWITFFQIIVSNDNVVKSTFLFFLGAYMFSVTPISLDLILKEVCHGYDPVYISGHVSIEPRVAAASGKT